MFFDTDYTPVWRLIGFATKGVVVILLLTGLHVLWLAIGWLGFLAIIFAPIALIFAYELVLNVIISLKLRKEEALEQERQRYLAFRDRQRSKNRQARKIEQQNRLSK